MGRIPDDQVRRLVARYGIATNPVEFAADAASAGKAAAEIGRPVAIKLIAEGVIHKSRAGGVLLDIAPQDVPARVEELLDTQRSNGVEPAGVTLEPMVPAGTEVVIGGLRNPGFGPVVMFGHGGVDIEILDDVAFALAPLDETTAEQLVASTRIGRALAARLPSRIPDLVEQILAIGGSAGVLLNEPVTDIDLNPVIVSAEHLLAVDARATDLDTVPEEPTRPDPQASYQALAPAIYPTSVAVIGASTDPAKMGNRAVRALLDFGFTGHVYPVNPKAAQICGIDAVASIEELPVGVDRAVVAVPAPVVPQTLQTLAARGTHTAHVYTADTPPFDRRLREQGLRVLGPNCIGHYAPALGMTMIAPSASSAESGGIAMVSQSGTYAGDAVRRGHQLGLRFSFVSSVGNCEDVSPSELLAFCEADPATKVVAFYLEGDRDAGAFFRFASTMTKPVVLLQGGRTSVGGAAAASHTGALASDPRLLRDVAREAGVHLAADLDELLDVLTLLQVTPTVEGDGLALVGSGGGVAVVGADRADQWGLTVPLLGPEARSAMEAFAAPGTSLVNPVDIPIWSLFSEVADEHQSFTGAILEAVAADEAIDALCVFLDLGTVYDVCPADTADTVVRLLTLDLLAASRKDKPLAVVLRSSGEAHQEQIVGELRAACREAGAALFDSVDRAVAAIGAVRALTRAKPRCRR